VVRKATHYFIPGNPRRSALKSSGRRGIFFILIGLLILVVGVFAVMYLLRQFGRSSAPAALPTPITEQVLVTARGILAGSVLGPDDLELKAIPVQLVPFNRLTEKTNAIGKITNVPMVAGEMVLPHHLSESTNVVDRTLGFTLADDQVLFALPILDLMSQLNILKRGDTVDILVSIPSASKVENEIVVAEEQAAPQLFTFDALQRLTITAVVKDIVEQQAAIATPAVTLGEATPQPPPEPNRTASEPLALLLALNPQDALVLKYLKDAGATFDIVLRGPNANQLFETVPVNPQYIIEKYELQTPR
jgi:Flp pilus assembly protein CpaB